MFKKEIPEVFRHWYDGFLLFVASSMKLFSLLHRKSELRFNSEKLTVRNLNLIPFFLFCPRYSILVRTLNSPKLTRVREKQKQCSEITYANVFKYYFASVIFRTDIYNLTSGRKEYNFKRTLKYDSKWLDSESFYSIPFIQFPVSVPRCFIICFL